MKIAFTSCICTDFKDQQLVWDDIAQKKPDTLVLLGDNVYIDVPVVQHDLGGEQGGFIGPNDARYPAHLLASHLHTLYQRQLEVPNFAALVDSVRVKNGVYSIWDDHDFLCNNSEGDWRDRKGMMRNMVISGNLMRCWREALANPAIRFPTNVGDHRISRNADPIHSNIDYDKAMTGYLHQVFPPDVVLHLTDGRSWRSKKDLLGTTQRLQMEQVIKEHPNAIHIVASGSTFGASGRSGWANAVDHGWLLHLASQYNILMISGDLHKNVVPDPIQAGAKKFYELTSSGAHVNFSPLSVKTKDKFGQFTRKFGLLDITDEGIHAQLFDHGNTTQGMQIRIPRTF